jgi:predicted Zn-dependent protease
MQSEWRAALYPSQHRPAQQRTYLDSARVLLDSLLAARPQEHMYHARLGQVYAALGRRGEALREAEAASRLMPPSKDALDGWMVVYLVARIHAMVGDKSAAIEELGRLLAVPHLPPISPAWLRVDRLWDPLRGDPRFQQLLAGR